jgi:hypothetical protein
VLEETSRGDLRLVEIQVKVEICSVVTCFHKSYRGPPKPLWHLTCADFLFLFRMPFYLSFICLSRRFDKMGCWLKTFIRLLKEGSFQLGLF